MIAVDDAHWADAASLHYVLYLARRLEGLPVLLALTIRTGDPATEPAVLAALGDARRVCRLRPRPLSEEAVRTLARELLGTEVDDAFAAECRRISGGVPFLVHELLTVVVAEGLPGTSATAGQISALGSQAIAHAALVRPGTLSRHAAAVARAVAVLGRYADTRRVAALAGLDASAVLEGLDALVITNILTAGDPLGFTHPILRTAVHDDMGVAGRSAAHASAARLLVDEGAPPAEAATHLLFTEPGTAPEAIELLRGAAKAANDAGAHEEAATYLRRALADAATADLRAELFHALGKAWRAAGDTRAVSDLEEALRLERDPFRRAAIARDLGELLTLAGATSAAAELCDGSLAMIEELDRFEALMADPPGPAGSGGGRPSQFAFHRGGA
ncbi:MAG: hypothetical protein ACYC91_11090 [Solirubrobacteraceae bacterium]